MDFDFNFDFTPSNDEAQEILSPVFKTETELQRIGREIQELRQTLDVINSAAKAVDIDIKDKRNAIEDRRSDYLDKIRRMQDEMNALINDLNAQMSATYDERYKLDADRRSTEFSIKEKEALYAKLFESQDAQERARQLAEEVFALVGDWEAFQKARDYQKSAIFMAVDLYKNGKNGIMNADDMGAGKTFQTIVSLGIIEKLFIKNEGRAPRTLWLTKKSLINSTPQEIKKWWDKKVVPMSNVGKPELREFVAESAIDMDAILLTNYEAVKTTPFLANVSWDILVVDEVHKLKGGANSGGPTAIWTAIKNLAHKTKFMFLLSGTPMVNDPMEMWSYLHIFTPEKFPTLKAFRRDFCAQKKVAGEFQLMVDPQKLLNGALKGQMIRRTIQEIGLEMPEFDIEERYLDMGDEQTRVYEEMRTKFFVWVDEQEGKMISSAAVIAQLNYLRQISVYPAMLHQGDIYSGVNDSVKVDETMDLIDDFADQCIIGCTFNAPLFDIQRRCHEKGITAEVLTGKNSTDSGIFERDFQSGDLRVFLMNTKMGAGMNLHKSPEDWKGGARYAITLDRWWSPADNEQFYRRIWRPGATQAVVAYDLYSKYNGKNTVDAFIQSIVEEKKEKIGNIAESELVRPGREWKDYLESLI